MCERVKLVIIILKSENKQLQHEIKTMKQCRIFKEIDELNEFNELKHVAGVEEGQCYVKMICIAMILATTIFFAIDVLKVM